MPPSNPSKHTAELHAFLTTRRSVRRFLPDPVPPGVLSRILETARFAPSAHNRQPWRFAAVVTEEQKRRLADAMGADFRRDLEADGLAEDMIAAQVRRSYDRILQAPVVVILCLTMVEMDVYSDFKRRRAEFRMAMQSVALAGGQMLLAAHAEGLGGVWICAPLFAQEVVQIALDLPGDWEPQGMLLLGYPELIPDPRQRKALNEIVVYR